VSGRSSSWLPLARGRSQAVHAFSAQRPGTDELACRPGFGPIADHDPHCASRASYRAGGSWYLASRSWYLASCFSYRASRACSGS
jgi:hypothetical protein